MGAKKARRKGHPSGGGGAAGRHSCAAACSGAGRQVVEPLDDNTLLVEFSNDQGRAYAVAPCPRKDLARPPLRSGGRLTVERQRRNGASRAGCSVSSIVRCRSTRSLHAARRAIGVCNDRPAQHHVTETRSLEGRSPGRGHPAARPHPRRRDPRAGRATTPSSWSSACASSRWPTGSSRRRGRPRARPLLKSLSGDQTVSVIRAFSYFSHLANIAEDRHHVRRREYHERQGRVQRQARWPCIAGRLRRGGMRADEIVRGAGAGLHLAGAHRAPDRGAAQEHPRRRDAPSPSCWASATQLRQRARAAPTTRRCCARASRSCGRRACCASPS